MRKLAVMFLVMALAGCATANTGRQYDASLVSQLKIGTTTQAQARDMFGKPALVEHRSNGNTVLAYSYEHYHSDGFLSTSGSAQTLLLKFDPSGTLIKDATTDTPVHTY